VEAPLQIELDAFSGLPNPRWELPATQAAEFLTLLRALKRADGAHGSGDGLGYRGFVVRPNGDPLEGYDEIRVYRGTVTARRGDRTDSFDDSGLVLERWLVRTAKTHVAEPVLQYVESEINA
jgi:hypothetical protein